MRAGGEKRRGSSRRATSSSRRASSSTASSSCTRRARRCARSRCSFRAGYMSRRPRDRAHEPQDPVREVGRHQVPRGGAREGRARVPARIRESSRRGELVPHPHAHARHRRRHGARDDGVDGRARVGPGRVRALRAAGARARRAPRARRAAPSPLAARRRRRDGSVGEDIDEIRTLYDAVLAERYDHAEPRLADLDQLRRHRRAAIPNRATFLAALALEPPRNTQDLAGGARCGGRRARHQHGAQRQGQGVGRGVRDLGGGRLVPVVALARRRGSARGGAPADVRRDDARAESSRGRRIR